jgi:hypothetical protein
LQFRVPKRAHLAKGLFWTSNNIAGGGQIPTFSNSQRLKIALGGFVSFIGLLVLACAMLTLTGAANLASLFQNELLAAIACAIGALDIACGLILVLSNK